MAWLRCTALTAVVVAGFVTFAAGAAEIAQSPVVPPQVRLDPYTSYKFRVVWDGRIIAGVSHVSALMRVTQAIVVTPGGGGPSTSVPGRTTYESITLEREVTRDPAFEDWADHVSKPGAPPPSPQSFRKDVEISVLDSSGHQLLLQYRLFACWPTQYTALSGLEASPASPPVQRLTLTCEVWDRDRGAGTGP